MSKNTAKKNNISLALFGLPFAAVGLGFLFLSIIPALWEWHAMKAWQATPAQVTFAQLQTHRGDDSTTWEATARYQYEFNNQIYTGSRLGIMSGADNIGSWHQDHSRTLKKHHQNKTPITLYVDPNNPSQSVIDRELRWGMLLFKSVFVIVFGGVGIGLIVFALVSKNTKHPEQLKTDMPWQANDDWKNPIASNAKAGLWGLWGFAVFWNAISMPILLIIPEELASKNYPALVALLFPIIGLFLLTWCAINTARWRRFGATPLMLSPYPAAIGGQMGGTLTLRSRLPAQTEVHITLSCVKSYYSGSGKNRKRRESITWSNAGQGHIKNLPQGSQIAFCFNPPKNLPNSELPSDSYHLWRVSIAAQLPGADLHRDFEIPAFQSDAQSHLNIDDSTQHPKVKNKREEALESLLNPTTIPGGIAIKLQPLRNAKVSGAFVLFGFIFFGAGIAISRGDAAIMGFIFGSIGAAIIAGGLYALLNSYDVQITREGIKATRKLLGFTLNHKHATRSQIKSLRIKSTGSSQSGKNHTEYFAVEAQLNNGRTIRVAESITGRTMAEEALESLALLSGYPKD